MNADHARLKLFYFSYLAVMGAFSPFFGPFLTSRGFSEWQLSVLMSLWYGTRALAPNLWDFGVARARKPIRWLHAGGIATLLATACFLPHWSFAGMVLVMLFFAGIYNALMPQYEALTLLHLRDTPERYSGIRVYGSIGFLLVVLGYGALFREVGAGYLIIAMLPLVLLLCFSCFASNYPQNSKPDAVDAPAREPTRVEPSLARLKRVLKPSFVALLWVGFCNQIAHGPLYVYFSVYLLHHGFNEFQVGALWSLGVACEILAFVFMRGLLVRVKTPHLIAFSLIAGALRWSAIGFWPDSGAIIASAQILHAFTFAAMHAAFMQLMSRDLAPADLGFAQALLYGVASGVGGVVSALIAGLLWKLVSDQMSFFAAAGFSLLALLALPWLWGNSKSQSASVKN